MPPDLEVELPTLTEAPKQARPFSKALKKPIFKY